MKKFITILLLVLMCFALVACSNGGATISDSDEKLPKGHATEIQYERPYTGTYTNNIQYLKDVDFEYVNSNTVMITLEDGSTMYIDSARIVFIKIAAK